ncbi:hypothetical protein ACP70R_023000 [Stipagrostis hirtigluma subsp. patula]
MPPPPPGGARRRRRQTPPPGGARRRRRRQAGGDAVGEDRISSLPDDMLREVLARLPSSEAVRTGVLSRRWRGLWTELGALWFYGVDPDAVDAALAQVTRPTLNSLEIHSDNVSLWDITPDRLNSLLGAAARLAPLELAITMWPVYGSAEAFELPCFGRTVHLSLDMLPPVLRLMPPASGEFTALKSLSLDKVELDPGALLPLCPSLRVLKMHRVYGFETFAIHSASLQVLDVGIDYQWEISCIDIDAPVLKVVDLDFYMAKEFSVSFSAPMVEKLKWVCITGHHNVGFGVWLLNTITWEYQLPEPGGSSMHHISLDITYEPTVDDESIAQELARLPVPNITALELSIISGHVFGPLLLHLLGICPALQLLKMSYDRDYYGDLRYCGVNCPCKQPEDWGSESISLTDLQVVEIDGFEGQDDEFDLVKLLFRCAPVLRTMILRVHDGCRSPKIDHYKRICSVFKEYPDVECYVYSIDNGKILYP